MDYNLKNMYNVLIVGAGQLGSRHLQGVLKINLPIHIEVYDISIESLHLSEVRSNEVEKANSKTNIKFIDDFNQISNNINLVIIATTSADRFNLFTKLVNTFKISNFILEKIIFQQEQDYDKTLAILRKNKINCWVNCPRRTYSIYREIKEKLPNVENLQVTVNGKNWGLACNSIHFIDLFSYLTNETEFSFNNNISEVINSKRENYFEFLGELTVNTNSGSSLQMISILENENLFTITIESENFIWEIFELENYANEINKKYKNSITSVSFTTPFQSDLTNLYVNNILSNVKCTLPSFYDSFYYHKKMINSFTEIFKNFHNYKHCQIT